MYSNEAGVGEAIADSGLERGDLFITTKLWNDTRARQAPPAFDESLTKLGLDYVDLYLIHWPVPASDRYVETWKAFDRAQAERARPVDRRLELPLEDLERIMEATGVVPSVNQIELHPRFQQTELRRSTRARDRHRGVEPARAGRSCSTTRRSARSPRRTIARRRRSILRWHIQLGNVVIPKSVTPTRIEENFKVFDFELGDDDMRGDRELDSHDGRIGS